MTHVIDTRRLAGSRDDVAHLPGGAFVEGQWQPTSPDRRLEVRDPEDGYLLGFVCAATANDVRRAVTYLRAEAATHPWPLRERRETLERAARLLARDAERFARIVSAESSKTITEAAGEVRRCVETLRLSAAASTELTGSPLDFEDSTASGHKIGWFTRKPVGLIAAITPFNDPLNLVAHKLGPALIGGNAVVLKPSERTPLSGLALVELLLEAGVPTGRIAAVVGGADAGEALVTDPRVDLISFTGGPRTAERIASSAGAKKIISELGGNNATIVCADADVEHAARAIVAGAFGVAGQNCLSVQRVYAHEDVLSDLLDRVVGHTRAMRSGPKSDPTTDMGPLITEAEARRVEQWVTEAVEAGATLHVGGNRIGAFHEPTVLTGVPAHCRVVRDEVFGPVVTIAPFTDVAEAVVAANDSEYGLQAGVFTRSMDLALAIADALEVGAVVINETSDVRIDSMPFGGFKKSGVGREGVRYAVLEMTEPKNTIVNLTDPTGIAS